MRDVSIDRIMTPDPITIGPDAPLVDARRLLQSHDVNHLPVVEKDKLVGILSASDMLKFVLLDDDAKVLKSLSVRQVMQKNPHVLIPTAGLREAADKLSSGGYHSLPVVGPDRTLIGIVTSSDLIAYLLQHLPVGDGSIRTDSKTVDEPIAVDISATIKKLEQIAARGESLDDVARALLAVSRRNRELTSVVEAAERYIRSGHADHEHSVLVKRLSDVGEHVTRLVL